MGYWKDLMTASESPRFCLSTEDYREECEKRDYYKNMRKYKQHNRRKIDSRLVLFEFTLL